MRCPPVSPALLIAGCVLVGNLVPAGPLQPQAWAVPEPAPKTPQISSAVVKKELTDIIEAQLRAFRAGDFAKAYEFAAGSIRDMFPPADFAVMVKTGYPVIAHSAKADYGLAFDTGEDAVVNVRIEDAAAKSGEFQYVLKKEAGGWKISGVSQLKAVDLSV